MKPNKLKELPVSALVSAILLTIAGCSTPDYRAPTLTPESVSSLPSAAGQAQTLAASDAPMATWWTRFGDRQLNELVRLAWQGNYDIKVASARLDSARHLAGVAEAAQLPNAVQEISAGRNRLAAVESRTGVPAIVQPLQSQAVLGWELDLFGRVKRSIEAAHASVDEREALRDDLRRLVLVRVVEAYLELRGAQMLTATLNEQLSNQANTLKLIKDREAAGSAAPAERIRFEAQLSLLRSRLPSAQAQERAARNRLATLSGQRLDAIALRQLDQPYTVQLPTELVVDEPVALLRRRPDVRAAERALHVAYAREGVAHADLYPRVSLSALVGNAGVAGDWLSRDAERWRVGGAVSWSIFDGGARQAQLKAAGAEVRAAATTFDKTVAVALEEADTAISNWVHLRRRRAELLMAQGFANESAELARTRYREGAENLLGVLDAERVSLSAEEQLVAAQRDLALAAARSYAALAGGFDLVQQK